MPGEGVGLQADLLADLLADLQADLLADPPANLADLPNLPSP